MELPHVKSPSLLSLVVFLKLNTCSSVLLVRGPTEDRTYLKLRFFTMVLFWHLSLSAACSSVLHIISGFSEGELKKKFDTSTVLIISWLWNVWMGEELGQEWVSAITVVALCLRMNLCKSWQSVCFYCEANISGLLHISSFWLQWKLCAPGLQDQSLSCQFHGSRKRQKGCLNKSFESEEHCRAQQKLYQNPEILDSAVFFRPVVFSSSWF